MHRRILPIVCLALLPFSAGAQTSDSHRQAALAVVEASGSQDMLETMLDQMRPAIAASMRREGLTPTQQAVATDYMSQVMDLVAGAMSWESMRDFLTDVYVDAFTEAELRELAAFYASPLGQKMLAKMPEMAGKSMEWSMSTMQAIQPEIQKLSQEMAAEISALE